MGVHSSSPYLFLILVSTIFFCPGAAIEPLDGTAARERSRRSALEIVIGLPYPPEPSPDPGYCPPPIPPPPPPPPEPECPPPPPPPCPPPPPPPKPKPSPPPPPPKPKPSPPPPPPKPKPISPRVLRADKVVQRFRQQVTIDPQRITNTWTGGNVCNYKGFSCAIIPDQDKNKGVIGTTFNGYNLGNKNGNLSLNGFVDQLEDIIYFHANSNNVTDLFASIASKLRFFYELDLSNNNLTGKFPVVVFNARNLTFLDLRFNTLTGELPPGVFELDLRALFLNNNRFSGSIPKNIFRTPVYYLTLASNKFSGSLPDTLGTGNTSTQLIEVLFTDNQLSGCIPYQIGLLKNNELFDASMNQLMGPIPASFGCLSEITRLNLSSNKLSGAVPESICKLPKLVSLLLQKNYFTQVGPECRKLIKKNQLDVSMNCIIDLPSQRDPSECKKFYSKPMRCPNEKSMSYIPCKLDHLLTDVDAKESKTVEDLAPSPAYAALDRENRHKHH